MAIFGPAVIFLWLFYFSQENSISMWLIHLDLVHLFLAIKGADALNIQASPILTLNFLYRHLLHDFNGHSYYFLILITRRRMSCIECVLIQMPWIFIRTSFLTLTFHPMHLDHYLNGYWYFRERYHHASTPSRQHELWVFVVLRIETNCEGPPKPNQVVPLPHFSHRGVRGQTTVDGQRSVMPIARLCVRMWAAAHFKDNVFKIQWHCHWSQNQSF